MKITDASPLRPAQALRRKAAASGVSGVSFEGFLSAAESGGVDEAVSTVGVSPIGSIDGMLALQSVSEEELRRKAVIKQGSDMLDELERLRGALLTGVLPLEVLRGLETHLTRQRAQCADPKLLEIIDDIELRAAVELAKLEYAHALRKNNDIA